MQRRTLLKLGLGAAAMLAVAGGGIALMRPGLVDGRMTPGAKAVFRGIARGVLEGTLPAEKRSREAALDAHLQRLEDTLSGFTMQTQQELSRLLALLASTPGRVSIAGLRSDWPDASSGDIQQALQGMRTSSLALRQQAYHALRDLTNAAYYADPRIWTLLGYPGPRVI